MMMIRTCLPLFCLWVAMVAPPSFGQDATKSNWEGTLDAHGQLLRLTLELEGTAGKSWQGKLRSLDQGDATFPMSKIRLDQKRLRFSIPNLNAQFAGKLDESGTTASGTFKQNGTELPLSFKRATADKHDTAQDSADKLKEAWIGELNMGLMKPVMQFRIMETVSGETTAFFDSITEGRTGFKATWSIEGKDLRFDVSSIKLKYRGTLNDAGDSAEGTWSQGGRDVPLTLKRQVNEYESENVWENRPQRPVEPFNYESNSVTFTNEKDDVKLAGTLTIPKKSGRHPAVVLISGSGPQDRDESIMEHKPFLVLADYLSRHGIAVLRYDDRGTNESSGNFGNATTEDFARDATAAVEFLKQHSRINPAEIGLAGHSEGGLVAPMVVGQRDDVAFVVLLAATGVDGVAINESQTVALLRAEGTSESEIEVATAINRAVIEASMKGGEEAFSSIVEPAVKEILATLPESDREEAEKNIWQGIQNSKRRLNGRWMQFFLGYDPRPALKKIKCPVLAIMGSKDLQVLPDLNMPEIEKALTEGGNQDFEIVILDGLNHLFQECETGAMSEYVTIKETFNPTALKTIGDWIAERTHVIK